jgi:hypothetical protein
MIQFYCIDNSAERMEHTNLQAKVSDRRSYSEMDNSEVGLARKQFSSEFLLLQFRRTFRRASSGEAVD